MELMLLAGLLFLATHLGLSSSSLRGRLVAVLGERGFQGVYSLIALASLIFMIWLYGDLPRYDYLWQPSPDLYLATKILMPVALIFAIGGFFSRNPTTVGMEGMLEGASADGELARGMTRITRHPFQWGIVMWAFAHLFSNGDTISVPFFTTFLLLGLLGGMAIDRKKAVKLGADWQAYTGQTSNLPFAAIAAGRNRLVVGELVVPVVAGLVGYGVIFWAHEWVGGVRII